MADENELIYKIKIDFPQSEMDKAQQALDKLAGPSITANNITGGYSPNVAADKLLGNNYSGLAGTFTNNVKQPSSYQFNNLNKMGSFTQAASNQAQQIKRSATKEDSILEKILTVLTRMDLREKEQLVLGMKPKLTGKGKNSPLLPSSLGEIGSAAVGGLAGSEIPIIGNVVGTAVGALVGSTVVKGIMDAANAIISMTNEVENQNEKFAKLSYQTGMTTQHLFNLDERAKMFGGTIADIINPIQNFSNALIGGGLSNTQAMLLAASGVNPFAALHTSGGGMVNAFMSIQKQLNNSPSLVGKGPFARNSVLQTIGLTSDQNRIFNHLNDKDVVSLANDITKDRNIPSAAAAQQQFMEWTGAREKVKAARDNILQQSTGATIPLMNIEGSIINLISKSGAIKFISDKVGGVESDIAKYLKQPPNPQKPPKMTPPPWRNLSPSSLGHDLGQDGGYYLDPLGRWLDKPHYFDGGNKAGSR